MNHYLACQANFVIKQKTAREDCEYCKFLEERNAAP